MRYCQLKMKEGSGVGYGEILNLYRIGNNFSRDFRFTVGEQIKNETLSMIILIYRVNKSFEGRKDMIEKAHDNEVNILCKFTENVPSDF